ncbi:MAG: alpha/beta fold hydrolase [Myxococcota bacterium]
MTSLFFLLACVATPDVVDPPPAPIEPDWTPCDLVDGSADGAAQCASVQVPLDHDAPSGRSIALRLKRLRAPSRPATRQLWWLHGGPGAKGTEALAGWAWLQEMDASLELITLDHRGTGGSTRLSCPDQEAAKSDRGAWVTVDEAAACGQALVDAWGEDLHRMTVDQAARDVARLARDLRRDRVDEVIVLGASYGTYWAHRVLQLDPESVDVAWLSAMVAPMATLHTVDARMNEVFDVVLERCKTEPVCLANLGPDPRARVAALHERLDQGHCDGLVSRRLLQEVSGEALMNPVIRSALLPMIARLDRCDEADVGPIVRWFDRAFGIGAVVAEASSTLPIDPPALYHFGTSEMLTGLDDADALEDDFARYLAATGRGTELARIAEDWPRYPAPEGRSSPAAFDGPMLLMHGTLDPTVAPADLAPLFDTFQGPERQSFVFEGAAHTIVGGTGIPGTVDCASVILQTWLSGDRSERPSCFGEHDLLRVVPNDVARDFFFGGEAWPIAP